MSFPGKKMNYRYIMVKGLTQGCFFFFCPSLSFRRYNIHYSEEAEADLPALVPPHHCAAVLVVLLQGHGSWGRLVHDHELQRARRDVLLLCLASGGFPSFPEVCHVHHLVPDHSDADGLCR